MVPLPTIVVKAVSLVLGVPCKFDVNCHVMDVFHLPFYRGLDLMGDFMGFHNRFFGVNLNAHIPKPGHAPYPHAMRALRAIDRLCIGLWGTLTLS